MKQVREGYKMTELGEIPQEWEVKEIACISNLITKGTTPMTYGYNFENTGVNFIKAENINNMGKIDISNLLKISKECHDKLNRSKIYENDLLLSIAGTLGKTSIANSEIIPANTNQAIAIIRLNNSVFTKYINYQMNSNMFKKYINKISTTGAQPNLSLKQVSDFEIPIPPLPEQKKIASILSKVDEQIELTDNLIEKTKDLKKGLMQNLLTKGIGHTEFKETEIGKIPTGWEVKKLGETGQIVTGSTPKTSVKENYGVDYLWVSPADMGENKYIKKTIKMLSITGFNQTRKIPKGGIMITCIGSTIGKIGIAGEELSTNQQINSLICNSNIFNEYMYYAIDFNFSHYISYISNQAVPIINKTTFSMFNIPVPSLDEQKKIASILSSVDTQIEEYQNKKSKLEELKKGLMQQLLTGKIRVKVDSDIYALVNQEVCENI